MKTISYIPDSDELVFKLRSLKKKPTKEFGSFKFWWDDKSIYGVKIMPFTKELEEFRKNLYTIRLGGIWKGIRITNEDIKEIRGNLLKKLEEKLENAIRY